MDQDEDLYENYIRVLNHPDSRMKAQEVLLLELAQFEFEVNKSEIVKQICLRELEEYAMLHAEIDVAIEKTSQEIQRLKVEMIDEKAIRKYKVEYELLAREVNKLPSTSILEEQIQAVKLELAESMKLGGDIAGELETKAKQFDLLLRTITDLQCSELEGVQRKETAKEVAEQSGEEFEEEEVVESSKSSDEVADMDMD